MQVLRLVGAANAPNSAQDDVDRKLARRRKTRREAGPDGMCLKEAHDQEK